MCTYVCSVSGRVREREGERERGKGRKREREREREGGCLLVNIDSGNVEVLEEAGGGATI